MNPRALLASPLGFLIGLSLGALGGGGSILAVPVLVYVAGQSTSAATATSLVLVGLTALVGIVPHWREGHMQARAGLVFGFVGVGGALVGSALNRRLHDDVLLLAFSGLMVVAGARMWTTSRSGSTRVARSVGAAVATDVAAGVAAPVGVAMVTRVVVAGSVVGFLTGLFGVGGGFVIPFAVSSMTGVIAGSRLAATRAPRQLQRWFVVLLAVVAAYTATRSALSLWAEFHRLSAAEISQ